MTLVRAGFPLEAIRGLGGRFAALPPVRRRAVAASLGWGVLVTCYGIGFYSVAVAGQTRGMLFLDAMFFLVALALPLLLIGLAAWLAEELEQQRELVAALAGIAGPLIGTLAATRDAVDRHGPASPEAIHKVVQAAVLGARAPDPSVHFDRVLAGQSRIEAALQRLSAAPSPRPAAVAAEPVAPAAALRPAAPERRAQPAPEPAAEMLPLLGEPEAAARPAWSELMRALDFPRDAEDREGFRALKAALRHHGLAQMLQAAEDVLNLLSQEGVFMDDLPVQPAEPAAWRRFMAGVRGAEVAGVGGIRDARALELARGLMKSDTIFRDTALFFQRRFDAVLSEFAAGAGDAELVELAGTRSGRAFMLLARLSGSLD